MQEVMIVVPCYNEEKRLRDDNFLPLLSHAATAIVFVDDGSEDGTPELLSAIARRCAPRVHVLTLRPNAGKAEAVRRGMQHALARGAQIVGYMDADASAPAAEIIRLLDAIQNSGADIVMGARVHLLGTEIQRSRYRHYLGRVFATVASLMLDMPVYDTQCGAKLFRDTPALRHALAAPFSSRWAFDVELLGRLVAGGPSVAPLPREKFLEVPLARWSDVAGSKLGFPAMLKSGVELIAIGVELRRRRARSMREGPR